MEPEQEQRLTIGEWAAERKRQRAAFRRSMEIIDGEEFTPDELAAAIETYETLDYRLWADDDDPCGIVQQVPADELQPHPEAE